MKTLQFPAPQSNETPLLITFAEAARLLGGVSTRHIYRLLDERKLRAVGSGRARRIVYASVLAYVEREAA